MPVSGIALWRSDDGGNSWDYPTQAASSTSSLYILDKPAVAVSWNYNSLGYVYVAFVQADRQNLSNSIFVAKSTDGGNTFGSPVLAVPGTAGVKLQAPQILVSPYNGLVYLLWTNFYTKSINISMSADYGQSWIAPIDVVSGSMVDGDINGEVMPSFPMARFNWVANKICIVWHEIEPNSRTYTDVYYIYGYFVIRISAQSENQRCDKQQSVHACS